MKTRTAMAFGSFDIFHPGHLYYLKRASRYGKLTVVVARDGSIKMLKGRSALMDERSRLEMIDSLKFVDRAVLGDIIKEKEQTYNILLRFRPDVIVLGYDQGIYVKNLRRFLSKNGLSPKIVRLKAYRASRFKSSKIKKALGL